MKRSTPASLVAVVAALGLTACGRTPQSILDPAGPVAKLQLGLLQFDLWMVAGIGVVVGALLIHVVVRFRRRHHDDDLPPQVEGNRRLEIAWTVAAALVLLPLALEPIRAEFVLAEMPNGPDVLRVEVIGHQWWWEFRYPDLGVVTANELHVPTGRKLRLQFSSADVMHSFWVPRLGGKMDVIPGRVTHQWLQADEPGVYSGQCAELCGASHANMRFRVVAEEPGAFDAWVKARRNPSVEPGTDLARRGQELFQSKGCTACHTIDGTAFQGKVGPNLTGVGARGTIAAGLLENNQANLARWLADPVAVKPGSRMPNLNLAKDEIDALVEFLRGLR